MNNKTYYDWLEISPKASPEVIEKAYKALVIKYHPDLQTKNKQDSEEIIKNINEAYSVLSNKEKRAAYDVTLHNDTVSKEDYDRLQQEYNRVKQQQIQQNYTQNIQQDYNQSNIEHQRQIEYERQVEAAKRKAYHDAYIKDLKNRGYKIRYRKTFKDYVSIAITIAILAFIAWILWLIPFTRNWIIDSCNNNPLIKLVLSLIYPVE